jgi:multisubunit Na+/H+ antiporter MnhB subunit
MSGLWLAFDLLLAGGILWLAWAALAATDGFKMIVLFIVFGLLVALAWVRLNAPDVALAEAAVGAGVTGALFLRTWRALGGHAAPAEAAPEPRLRAAAAAIASGVIALLGGAYLLVARPVAGLEGPIVGNLADSGVSNPVTAVLLNYRAYDTLLEVVVLLAAVVLVWMIGTVPAGRRGPGLGPIFLGFARLALPVMVLAAGYLLWLGGFAPGGAFQAGAMLGAVGIVLVVAGLQRPGTADRGRARIAFASGVAGFAGAGVLTVALGGTLLEFPNGADKAWIVAIEALLTLSIGATLAGLFLGGAPVGRRGGGG